MQGMGEVPLGLGDVGEGEKPSLGRLQQLPQVPLDPVVVIGLPMRCSPIAFLKKNTH